MPAEPRPGFGLGLRFIVLFCLAYKARIRAGSKKGQWMFKSQSGQLEVRLGLGSIQESWGLKGVLVIYSGFVVLRERPVKVSANA